MAASALPATALSYRVRTDASSVDSSESEFMGPLTASGNSPGEQYDVAVDYLSLKADAFASSADPNGFSGSHVVAKSVQYISVSPDDPDVTGGLLSVTFSLGGLTSTQNTAPTSMVGFGAADVQLDFFLAFSSTGSNRASTVIDIYSDVENSYNFHYNEDGDFVQYRNQYIETSVNGNNLGFADREYYLDRGIAYGTPFDPFGTYTLLVAFQTGVPLLVSAELDCDASVSGMGSASCDFFHSAHLLGVSNIVDQNGDPVASYQLSDSSPVDFARGDPNSVPEPGMWVLLVAGFGGAGAALRRRSAVCA